MGAVRGASHFEFGFKIDLSRANRTSIRRRENEAGAGKSLCGRQVEVVQYWTYQVRKQSCFPNHHE
jgi:hypothetical protein